MANTSPDMATSPSTTTPRKRIVVVGLGMVGIAFIEKLIKLDTQRQYEIIVIGEEPHVAYNRVGLTSFFTHREVEQLYLNPLEWYKQHLQTSSLTHHLSTLVTSLSPSAKTLTISPPPSTPSLTTLPYDHLILATGSRALLPTSTPGHDAAGVFVYRTIADLQSLITWSSDPQIKGSTGVVVGGGLLGLEAAKALMDLGVFGRVVVVERNGWVLSRQVDGEAGGLVVEGVRGLGVEVLCRKRVGEVDCEVVEGGDGEEGEEGEGEGKGKGGNKRVKGIRFEDGDYLPCSTICFAIGIKPRDELAREAGIECNDKGGGIVVDDSLQTSAPDVYAIGECASWKGQTFGLIGPGVEMADVLAFNLTQAHLHTPRVFKRPDLSTKLKLLGVEVASFGDFFADRDGPRDLPPKLRRELKKSGGGKAEVKALTYKDPFLSVYKKYIFTSDGKYLLGGMMIGDTSDYVRLVPLVKTQKELDIPPSQLILGAKKDNENADDDLPDDTQICSCHNVTKADLVAPLKSGECTSLGDLKSCTKAGTGCGGCMPLVTSIFNRTMASLGAEVKNNLCPHFPSYSRADLYNIISVKRLRTLPDVMREAGGADPESLGCEVCKPAIASIFASLWNDHVMSPAHHGLQDTNDRFMGNIQRNGTFSVVPRVAAGEITPEKLIVIGEVAREYNLYTKITGGQRIDMFGARKQDLLKIWKKLVDAGMESGHAYAKSLRTVKSCVGTTWCRFGVGDSVGMAVRLEERYKGLRAPHKFKGGVSGCVRECAEAGNKDFGLIATEKGFNILICGNGGTTPKHSILLAKDVPPTNVIPILDRFLMFYIRTADKLQRTARWLEALPGGIDYLREVILDDRLGICASLEAQMQELVDSYFDEWAEAINNPAMQERFKQFANTDEGQPPMEVEIDRGQERPVMWPREDEGGSAKADFKGLREKWSSTTWQPVLEASYFKGADDLPNGISASIKRGDTQLAVWRIKGKYYASQQMCPHKRTFALSDGLVGTDPSAASCSSATLPPSPPTTPPSSSPSTSPPPSPGPTSSSAQSTSSTSSTSSTQPPSSTSPTSSPSTCSSPSSGSSPYISCPFHKRNFSLTSGSCKNDNELSIATFDVEERKDGMVYMKLPPVEELDRELGTKRWMVKKGEAGEGQFGELDELNKRKGVEGKKGRRGRKPGASEAGKEVGKRMVETMAGGGGCGGPGLEW